MALALDVRVQEIGTTVDNHTQQLGELRTTAARIEARFDAVDSRLGRFQLDVDRRFEVVDRRFERVEHQLDRLDDRISRQFVWLIGVQLTTLASIVATLAAAVSKR